MSESRTHVSCERSYDVSADSLWGLLSDFYSDWHPAMRFCEQEAPGIRRFGVLGEKAIYRERLEHHDDERRCYTYTLLEGVSGLSSYEAQVRVEALAPKRAKASWSVDIEAIPERTAAIARGSKAVFVMGLEALDRSLSQLPIQSILLNETSPSLGLDLAGDMTGEGPLCLFLHGIGGHRANWERQLLHLHKDYRCVALDVRGYGDSAEAELSPALVAEDILRVMGHFQAERVHLIGLSFGSWLAACFAHLHPERLASLVCSAGSTGMGEASAVEIARFAALRLDPIRAGRRPSDIADEVVARLAGPNSSLTSREAMRLSMASLSRSAYLRALECFIEPPFRVAFEDFTFPCLFVAGEHDTLAPPAEMRAVSERIAGARFVGIAGAGHLINLEASEAYNRCLADFFADIA